MPDRVCGKSSAVTHVDFSADGEYMQTNDQSYELLFYRTKDGELSTASKVRDTEWATWTCTLGWPVQGIWPPFADGSDINAADRSPDRKLIITGDDDGAVKVFNYPAIEEGAGFVEGLGHSSHVTNCRFVTEDSRDTKRSSRTRDYCFLTAGGNDRAVIVWDALHRL